MRAMEVDAPFQAWVRAYEPAFSQAFSGDLLAMHDA